MIEQQERSITQNAQMPEPVLPPGMPNLPPGYAPVDDPADPDGITPELPPYSDPDMEPPKPLRMVPINAA